MLRSQGLWRGARITNENVVTMEDSPDPQHVCKRPKTDQPIPASHPGQLATTPSSSKVKTTEPAQKVAGDSTPKFMLPAAGTKGRGPHMNRHFSGGPPEISQQQSVDPLIGHKVMIRWPEDDRFYEAVIYDYDAETDKHALVYDIHTPEQSWEWIDLKEQGPEDLKWLQNEPAAYLQSLQGARRRGVVMKPASPVRPVSGGARGKEILVREKAPMEDVAPQHDGAGKSRSDEIIIYHTESLLRKVKKVLDVPNPDPRKWSRQGNCWRNKPASLMDMPGLLRCLTIMRQWRRRSVGDDVTGRSDGTQRCIRQRIMMMMPLGEACL